MQLGTDLSTSHVENNFIGTGFVFVAKYNFPPPSAAIFSRTYGVRDYPYVILLSFGL